MGRSSEEVVRVVATVSRHNSDDDAIDDALVEELRLRINAIVSEPKYERITAVTV